MLFIYNILLHLAAPFLFCRLWWRGRKEPRYRDRVHERLGIFTSRFEKSIWIHAVSVGESIAAIPLIKSIQTKYPDMPIVVSTMTPTGAERIEAALGTTVHHLYLPYDFPNAVNRFLNGINPVIAIIMETELWPNLLAACHRRAIPACLLNARLSEKSAKTYSYIAYLTKQMLLWLNKIAAQGEQDAKRFIALGAKEQNVFVTGNLKFDIQISADIKEAGESLRQAIGKDRFVWIAASTHEGEEEIILAAQQMILSQHPNLLLILVPRHPKRFDTVANLLHDKNMSFVRRSQQQIVTQETSVYLADTMGELLLLYAASDLAFVGGSLIPRGGHNMLEPAALAKAILTGPHLFNFAEISQKFFAADAMLKVENAKMLADKVQYFIEHPDARDAFGERAHQVVIENRGALAKQVSVVEQLISMGSGLL